MKLLLVEDDPMVGSLLQTALIDAGYNVELCEDAECGEVALKVQDYDAIVLDVGLPGRSGLDLLKSMRRAKSEVPVLILSAKVAPTDRVLGLDLGADDYLVKPFDLDELLARVRALLRRKPIIEAEVLKVDTLEVNTRSRTVSRGGQTVRLTAKEYALLECMVRQPETVLTRDYISEQVWNEPYDSFSNLIEEYIKRLRKKIDTEGHRPLINVRRGEGYILTSKPQG